jgi:hypothetical protein
VLGFLRGNSGAVTVCRIGAVSQGLGVAHRRLDQLLHCTPLIVYRVEIRCGGPVVFVDAAAE